LLGASTVQAAGLEQDAVWDRDLAYVVERAREPDQLAPFVVEPEAAGKELAVTDQCA
jgi:hypothetical protein